MKNKILDTPSMEMAIHNLKKIDHKSLRFVAILFSTLILFLFILYPFLPKEGFQGMKRRETPVESQRKYVDKENWVIKGSEIYENNGHYFVRMSGNPYISHYNKCPCKNYE